MSLSTIWVTIIGVAVGVVATLALAKVGKNKMPGVGIGAGVGGGIITLLAIAVLGLPKSCGEFGNASRRRGDAAILEVVRRDFSGCLVGGQCDRQMLARTVWRGCFALRGEVDRTWLGHCEMPESVRELSRSNALVLSTFGEKSGGPPDYWLVTPLGVFRVMPADQPQKGLP